MQILSILLQFGVLCKLSGIGLCLDKISVDPAGNLVDTLGRVRIFHGFNAVKKEFPWYNESLFIPSHMDYFQQWGFNFVRLGCMWSGVFPNPDHKANETYLDVLESLVDRMAAKGIYVLLDMHQDVMSSRFNTYDGVPSWLVDQLPKVDDPSKQFPWPFRWDQIQYEHWSNSYMSLAVGRAFQGLYSNVSDSWSHWAEFWTTVARRFGGKSNVIGYELINEPWAGDVFANPARLLPGYTGKHNLLPVYDHLVNAIRRIDTETLLFYEPVTWAYVLPGEGDQGTGFDHIPGGNQWRNRSVLSYHYYCWLLTYDDPRSKFPFWKKEICDDVLSDQIFRSVLKDQQHNRYGIFLTEFGLCGQDNSSSSVDTVECDHVLNMADNFLQSWAYWDSDFFEPDRADVPKKLLVQQFARIYPTAVAGRPRKIVFDQHNAKFSMTYELDVNIQAATVLFVPLSVHFGSDWDNVALNVYAGLDQRPVHYSVITNGSLLELRILESLDQFTLIDVRIWRFNNLSTPR